MSKAMCPCGLPIHYSNPLSEYAVSKMVEELGECVPMRVATGETYAVPRHYIALHGVAAQELPELAQRYGFRKL